MNLSRLFFLTSIFSFFTLIVACQPNTSQFKEFQPQTDSLLKITFLYPVNWEFESKLYLPVDVEGMSVNQPYEDRGLLGISVRVLPNPQSKMLERIETHLSDIEYSGNLELLNDQSLEIDGHSARWLTIRHAWEYNDPGRPYIHEFIYLLAEDRYHTITLYIPESEVGGRFHTEFKAMIETIKVLP